MLSIDRIFHHTVPMMCNGGTVSAKADVSSILNMKKGMLAATGITRWNSTGRSQFRWATGMTRLSQNTPWGDQRPGQEVAEARPEDDGERLADGPGLRRQRRGLDDQETAPSGSPS